MPPESKGLAKQAMPRRDEAGQPRLEGGCCKIDAKTLPRNEGNNIFLLFGGDIYRPEIPLFGVGI